MLFSSRIDAWNKGRKRTKEYCLGCMLSQNGCGYHLWCESKKTERGGCMHILSPHRSFTLVIQSLRAFDCLFLALVKRGCPYLLEVA